MGWANDGRSVERKHRRRPVRVTRYLAPFVMGLTLRSMRPGTVLGALLIFAGVVALSVGGFSFTSREKVAEVGPVKVTTEKQHSVPVPTIVAGLAVVAGVVLIVASSRKAR